MSNRSRLAINRSSPQRFALLSVQRFHRGVGVFLRSARSRLRQATESGTPSRGLPSSVSERVFSGRPKIGVDLAGLGAPGRRGPLPAALTPHTVPNVDSALVSSAPVNADDQLVPGPRLKDESVRLRGKPTVQWSASSQQ